MNEPAIIETSLSSSDRSLLERVCVEARGVSEVGSRAALESLGVERPEPYSHLSPDQKDLRVRLRARARQLADKRFADGRHEIDHLVEEAGYEQWHRMLFARFLAENGLLIHPEHEVPVSLEECEELAEAEGAADGWDLAARYAGRMLPEIFRTDAPTLELKLAPEHEQELESLLESLPPELFQASDALGWVYQYWQSEKKNEVNKSEVKIGADELAPVTQLFTEPYMVQFLLHNSLGAWWTSRHPDEELPVELTYYRTLEDGTPAAGPFEGWPARAAKLKVLDPCCGSGHFLVEAFRLLVPMRMLEEGLSAREAGDAVLRDNLYGLELDARCTEIAAFALALAAWTYPGAEGYRPLPELNVACSGLAVGASKKDWEKFAGDDERLKAGMGRLWDLFKDAPTLGSLIDPTRGDGDLFVATYGELKPLLQKALEQEDPRDYEGRELGVTAQGIAKAAELLAAKYHLVTTNPPYLSRGKQDQKLRDFCESHYGLSKNDLATVFLQRCLEACADSGTASLVLPGNWLFLTRVTHLRKNLLARHTIVLLAAQGPRAFRTSLYDFPTVLLAVTRSTPAARSEFAVLNGSRKDTDHSTARQLIECEVGKRLQASEMENPDSRILLHREDSGLPTLSVFAEASAGIQTGDNGRYVCKYWELQGMEGIWELFQNTTDHHCAIRGQTDCLRWEHGEGALSREPHAVLRGLKGVGQEGVALNRMGDLKPAPYYGNLANQNITLLLPREERFLAAIWAFASSKKLSREVRRLDSKAGVTPGTFVKVPFDIEHWRSVAAEQYPEGLPEPYSEDPTQWIFKGTVTPSEAALQVAVARLLGYRWPEQMDDGLDDLVDDDGIVCIPAVRGEQPAASRLQQLLAHAYGDSWKAGLTETLLAEVGYQGKTLDDWLRDGFFQHHCELFHQRPFIWHIWDGRKKDGFHALVNYHELDRRRLETLTYTYLGDWIRRQAEELKQEKGGAEGRLEAAKDLQRRLELILKGEKPYDIFVRWKPLEEQPIGWEPDLNDGVRLNIRPFKEADVLRKKPKIHWKKDRGKDTEDAPWYHLFQGARVNDHHLALEEKQKARAAMGVD